MKVYQIIAEGPTVDIRRSQVLGPDGRPFFTVVDQDGNELFRGTEEQANVKRDEIQRRIRPARTTPDASNVDPEDVRGPGHRPNTPSMDNLTAGEQRKLNRTGRITRSGVTYTAANIQSATAEKARLANVNTSVPGDTRPTTTAADTPTPEEAKSMFSKLKKWAKGGITGKIVTTLANVGKGLLGGTIVNLVLKSIDIVTVVAAHNAYFTELEKFVDADTPEKRTEIVNNLGDIRQNQIIEPTTELFFGALGMALFGSAGAAIAAGIVGVAAAGVSGGTSLILTLIAGGVAMYGAYEGSIYAAKNVPMPGGEGDETIYEFFRTKFDEVWLTPGHLRDLAAEGVDINFGTYVYGLMLNPMQTHTSPLSIPGPTGAYGLVKKLIPGESIAETADDQEEDDTASVADNIAPKLKKAVLADPKLKQLYILGKAEIKKAVRDQEKTNAS
jgi:hypothetical protein